MIFEISLVATKAAVSGLILTDSTLLAVFFTLGGTCCSFGGSDFTFRFLILRLFLCYSFYFGSVAALPAAFQLAFPIFTVVSFFRRYTTLDCFGGSVVAVAVCGPRGGQTSYYQFSAAGRIIIVRPFQLRRSLSATFY
jgi:hypothetical protein